MYMCVYVLVWVRVHVCVGSIDVCVEHMLGMYMTVYEYVE